MGAGSFTIVLLLASTGRGIYLDDPFIYYRYGQHLAAGQGWAYNLGQPGTDHAFTSPVYVLILALGHRFGAPVPSVGTATFVLALTGAAVLSFVGLRRVGHLRAGIVAGLLVSTSPLLLQTRGMESALFLCALAAALVAHVQRRAALTGVAVGVLVLIRPEGILLALVLAATLVRRRSALRAMAVAAAVVVAPWVVYAQLRFGHVLPTTLSAKVAQGESRLAGGQLFVRALTTVPRNAAPWWTLLVVIAAVIGLARVARERSAPWSVPLLAFTVLYVIVYSALGVPGLYRWYYAVPAYCAIVLAALGVEALSEAGLPLTGAAAVLAVAIAALGVQETPSQLPPSRAGYAEAGRWIADNTPPEATVAATQIGIVGYYSGRPMTDYLGLFSSDAAAVVRRGDLRWWVSAYQPDYWVMRKAPDAVEDPVRREPWFGRVFVNAHENRDVIVARRIAPAPPETNSEGGRSAP
jgi:hypothetical protein